MNDKKNPLIMNYSITFIKNDYLDNHINFDKLLSSRIFLFLNAWEDQNYYYSEIYVIIKLNNDKLYGGLILNGFFKDFKGIMEFEDINDFIQKESFQYAANIMRDKISTYYKKINEEVPFFNYKDLTFNDMEDIPKNAIEKYDLNWIQNHTKNDIYKNYIDDIINIKY